MVSFYMKSTAKIRLLACKWPQILPNFLSWLQMINAHPYNYCAFLKWDKKRETQFKQKRAQANNCSKNPFFRRKRPRFWGPYCTVGNFQNFCFAPKTCRDKMICCKNDILREISKNCSSKLSFFTSFWLVFDQFWWTILDNSMQNIIFTAVIFDARCFTTRDKNPAKNPLCIG